MSLSKAAEALNKIMTISGFVPGDLPSSSGLEEEGWAGQSEDSSRDASFTYEYVDIIPTVPDCPRVPVYNLDQSATTNIINGQSLVAFTSNNPAPFGKRIAEQYHPVFCGEFDISRSVYGLKYENLGVKTGSDFVPLDSTKYKTELCRSYQLNGFCRYGFRCNYAHGLSQLKTSFHHGKYKTKNCKAYHTFGFCRYGARCSFIHDTEEGILKCPITEREILEELHYRPMSAFQHIASITWRMVESKFYPASELYFLTPMPGGRVTSTDELSGETEEISSKSMDEMHIHKDRSVCSNSLVSLNVESPQNESFTEENIKSISLPSTEDYACSTDTGTISLNSSIERDNIESLDSASSSYTSVEEIQEHHEEISYLDNSSEIEANNENSNSDNRDEIQGEQSEIKQSLNDKNKTPVKLNIKEFLNCLKKQEIYNTPKNKNRKFHDFIPSDKKVERIESKAYPSRRMFDSTKYKTELCRCFQYNKYCQYEDACLYAHGKEDLKIYPQHPLFRTKECFSFHKKGFCLYGSRCQFRHVVE